MAENLEQRLCTIRSFNQRMNINDIKYFKCERCDGYGNYTVAGMKMRCVDYIKEKGA